MRLTSSLIEYFAYSRSMRTARTSCIAWYRNTRSSGNGYYIAIEIDSFLLGIRFLLGNKIKTLSVNWSNYDVLDCDS
ncbi:hypothetical protein BN903_160 [Halorubrum sp. AJ67]|nr:hypothetical protein BN903_160 [Halorubrum sp. AJ67]